MYKLILLLIPLILLSSCTIHWLDTTEDKERRCIGVSGEFDRTHLECLKISTDICENIGGIDSGCGNPDRHKGHIGFGESHPACAQYCMLK